MKVSTLLSVASTFAVTSATAGKVLIIGDSWGEFGCGTIQEFCKDQTIINKAVSGSTAYQWGDGNTLSVNDAFTEAGTGVTHVWISLGGNDVRSFSGLDLSSKTSMSNPFNTPHFQPASNEPVHVTIRGPYGPWWLGWCASLCANLRCAEPYEQATN